MNPSSSHFYTTPKLQLKSLLKDLSSFSGRSNYVSVRLVFIYVLFLLNGTANAQKSLQEQGERINSKSIFLKTEGNSVRFFTQATGEDNAEPIGSEKLLALKGNFANVYFKWLNPLKYTIQWKDSLYDDPAEQRLREFTTIIARQMGVPDVKDQNKANDELKTEKIKASAIADKKNLAKDLDIPVEGFASPELSQLFLLITLSGKEISISDVALLNSLIPQLADLDQRNNSSILKWTEAELKRLLELKESVTAIAAVKEAKETIEGHKNAFATFIKQQETIISAVSKITLSNKLLNSVLKTYVQLFIDKTNATLQQNKEAKTKLEEILSIFDKSFEIRSDRDGYFKVREVSFANGQILQTGISIIENTYDQKTNEVKKGNSISSATMVFRKYDPVTISVSTGIFYASTSIKKIGVAPAGDKFTVVEETQSSSSAVTALFANLNIGLGSRYLSPLIQLGIDPTKPSPFLLLGGGFSIPAVRFSITAGGVWTWQQSLNKLALNQEISSSAELEKDIKSVFQINPKGWYIGVQYNF
jgi:hypothetical protein